MGLFKKNPRRIESPTSKLSIKIPSLAQEQRILTAEGWKRRSSIKK